MRNLSFEAPPAMPVAANATTPNPGSLGAVLWSTIENQTLFWNGSMWAIPRQRSEPYYEEIVRAGGRVVAVINWSDATRTRKLSEVTVTREKGWAATLVDKLYDPQQAVQQTHTTTFVRDAQGRVTSAHTVAS